LNAKNLCDYHPFSEQTGIYSILELIFHGAFELAACPPLQHPWGKSTFSTLALSGKKAGILGALRFSEDSSFGRGACCNPSATSFLFVPTTWAFVWRLLGKYGFRWVAGTFSFLDN
jgi:hypothetical protein